MNGIGLDCGNATLKLVLLSPEGKFLWEKTAFHYGAVVQSARRLLGALLAADPGACGCPVVITGNAGDRLKEGCDALAVLGRSQPSTSASGCWPRKPAPPLKSAARAPASSPAWIRTPRPGLR